MFSAFALAFILSGLFALVPALIRKKPAGDRVDQLSSFECGFDPFACLRRPFSVRFFTLVILFLVFDVESVLLFPYIGIIFISLSRLSLWGLYFFSLILYVGLLYEWYNTLLEWASLNKLSLSCWAHNPNMVTPLKMIRWCPIFAKCTLSWIVAAFQLKIFDIQATGIMVTLN